MCDVSPTKSGMDAQTVQIFKRQLPLHEKHLSVLIWSETWYLYLSLRFVVLFSTTHSQFLFFYSAMWNLVTVVGVSRNAGFSIFPTSDISKNLRSHPAIWRVIRTKESACITASWLRLSLGMWQISPTPWRETPWRDFS